LAEAARRGKRARKCARQPDWTLRRVKEGVLADGGVEAPLMPFSLSDIPFLRDAPEAALRDIEDEVEWFSLPGGWPLIQVGDPPESIYFVLSGTLAAFQVLPDGEARMGGFIRAGEPVGEMAMVAGERHRHPVYAIRDSELLRISRTGFNRLVRLHPSIMQQIARIMLLRTRRNRRGSRAEPKTFALIATSPTIDLHLRAQELKLALEGLGKKAIVVGEEAKDRLSVWFDQAEQTHDAVLLVTAISDSAWFRLCLRQADRLMVFARSDARPSVPLLPQDSSPARRLQLVDLVLCHMGGAQRASTAEEWRAASGAARIFHWRGLNDRDCGRLARVLAGQAIGLVLSGGGARAYAHIGVVRALREFGVSLDMVGGTSMGAIIAACVALGWTDDEIECRIREAFVDSNPLGDYVLPVVALSRGKRTDERLERNFGSATIEDLQTPFFCVSTDLAAGRVRVHRTGLLRHALRASIALPGILPPVVEGESILVDGAVLKNFPVDIMRDLYRGPIIGVDVARRSHIDPRDFVDPPPFFGWVAQKGLQAPPPIASLLIRAATLTVDPWEGRAKTDLLILPDMPNVDLRDWKRFDEAVIDGYETAVAALQRTPLLGNLDPPEPELLEAAE